MIKRFGQGGRGIKKVWYELLQDLVGQAVSELQIFEIYNFLIFFTFFNSKSVNFGRRESIQVFVDAQWSKYDRDTPPPNS